MNSHTTFFTWTTYATWLPGDDRGSTDHARDGRNAKPLRANRAIENHMQSLLKSEPVLLDEAARVVVDKAIRDLAEEKGWSVHALNVRTNHVHLVLRASVTPEQAMTACKARATRDLRIAGLFDQDRKIWTRHGSTRNLHTEQSIHRAVLYAMTQQEHPTRFQVERESTDRA